MYKTIKVSGIVIILFLFMLIWGSCANVGTISGGDKDSIPPVMVGSNPVMADTSYKKDRVTIYFDEFFSLKDINQEFYSSPPFKKIPDFKIKKKSLIVKFKEPLHDSVTYSLYFGKGIVDFNENNVLKNLRFIFSTKSVVDSFSVSGNLRNAFDHSVLEKAVVMLFENHDDSIPYKKLPDYLCKTDTSGNFSIDFIRPGSYRIFALDDKNSNQVADFFEPRAFLDSLVIPRRKTWYSIDSLKAGIILHDTINNLTDSLENDSVIVSHHYSNKPSNLQLYLFAEDNQVQKVLDYSRKERGKMSISFALPVTKEFEIKPLNFIINSDSVLTEKNPANDTITWWVTSKMVQAMDSVQVKISYLSKDSIGNPLVKADTIIFEFREKKADDAWKRKSKDEKSVKNEYLKLEFLTRENKVDLNKPLRISSPFPLESIDTSRMRLFEIIDTNVVDTKEQLMLKAFRLKKDLLEFRFKRPLAGEFYLYPMNFKSENWYSTLASDSNRVYTCQITDPSVLKMDTIKVKVEFDNHFFLDQIQVLTDTAILPISSQKILSRKRSEANLISLVFNKPLNSQLTVMPDDFTAPQGWYRISAVPGSDSINILITDKNVSNKDTLTLSVRCFDHIGMADDSIYFNETMRLLYKEKEQFLVSAARTSDKEVKLAFNKKIPEDPLLEPLNFTLNNKWYQLSKNITGDTISCLLTDEMVSTMDSLKFLLKFKEVTRKGKTLDFSDTVFIPGKKLVQYNLKTNVAAGQTQRPVPKKVQIYLPADYKLMQDSIYTRHRLVTKKWKENTKYLFRLDSLAFKSIFGIYNQASDYEFSTPQVDSYAILMLKFTNLKPSLDSIINLTVKKDTLGVPDQNLADILPTQKEIDGFIGTGNFIFQLLGEKDIVLSEFQFSNPQRLKLEYLNPAKYRLKLIFDRNGNGKWDTGDYFKHLQPERIILNGEPINLKSGNEFELTWDVGEGLIKSFTMQSEGANLKPEADKE
ncbi:MAG: Ig-like domain-containing domain [Bacteroidales bacterium]